MEVKKRIPFNIKYKPEILSGKYKLITKGYYRPVVLDWDTGNKDYPLLVKLYASEDTCKDFPYTAEGSQYREGGSLTDLEILTDEPVLTNWERAYSTIRYGGSATSFMELEQESDAIKSIRSEAAALLEEARKEILRQDGSDS